MLWQESLLAKIFLAWNDEAYAALHSSLSLKYHEQLWNEKESRGQANVPWITENPRSRSNLRICPKKRWISFFPPKHTIVKTCLSHTTRQHHEGWKNNATCYLTCTNCQNSNPSSNLHSNAECDCSFSSYQNHLRYTA